MDLGCIANRQPERHVRIASASNNRDHAPQSLYYCLLAPHIYIWVLFVVHIPFVVNCTFNATPTEVATTSSWCCIFWKMDRFDHRSYETSKGFSRPEVCTNLTLRKDNSPIIRIRLCSLAILLWRGSGRGMVAQAGADIGILVAMVVCCGVVVWVGRCAVVAMAVDYVGPDLDFEVPELVLVLFLFSILRRRNLSWSSSLFLFLILSRRTSSWSSSLFLSLILRRRNLSWSSSLFLSLILRRRNSSWSSSLFLSLIVRCRNLSWSSFLFWILRRRTSSWSSSLFLFLILRCRNSSWSSSLFLFLILRRRNLSWTSSCLDFESLSPFCCDRKAEQSFTLWQQATCHDHSSRMLVIPLNRSEASIDRVSAPQTLYNFLFAPRIYVCYSSRTSRSWWIAHSTQRQPRGCNSSKNENSSSKYHFVFM